MAMPPGAFSARAGGASSQYISRSPFSMAAMSVALLTMRTASPGRSPFQQPPTPSRPARRPSAERYGYSSSSSPHQTARITPSELSQDVVMVIQELS